MDKSRKKELLRQHKEQQAAEARRKMCLGPDQLRRLLDYLEGLLEETGCDHTLRLSIQWAEAAGLNSEQVATSLREFGGYCDCEVLANVTPDKFGWPE